MKEKDVMVSIICLTYNHERYIRNALDGFVMQITNFKYEIIIHDDASTDNTASIIREYEKKYPDLIHAIYQTENQYSKGVSVENIAFNRARGKYIAYCEGDDFWIDAYKLQKQFDFMETHQEYSLCVHAAYRVASDGEKLNDYQLRPNSGNKDYTVEEIIKGGGGIFATCSYFSRAIYDKNIPDFYYNAPVGDYPFEIYMALKGKVYYMDEFMSSYRVNAVGSWSERVYSDINKRIEHFMKIADMLDQINVYTSYKYNDAICWRKKCDRFYNIFLLKNDLKELKKDEYKEFYSEISLRKKFVIHIAFYFPGLFKILKKTKQCLLKRDSDDR